MGRQLRRAHQERTEGDYTRGLAEIAALRPVYYTYKGNDTNDAPSHARAVMNEEDLAKIAESPLTVPYPNSSHNNRRREGRPSTRA